MGGGNGGAGTASLSAAEIRIQIAATLEKWAARHTAAQLQPRTTRGNPQLGKIRRTCRGARRDRFYSNPRCAWQICRWRNLANHRREACTSAFGPKV